MIFERDPDSNGFSIEIYAEPDATGGMEYLGRLDLFDGHLVMEGGPTLAFPSGWSSTMRRDDIEAWARAEFARWKNIR